VITPLSWRAIETRLLDRPQKLKRIVSYETSPASGGFAATWPTILFRSGELSGDRALALQAAMNLSIIRMSEEGEAAEQLRYEMVLGFVACAANLEEQYPRAVLEMNKAASEKPAGEGAQ